MKLKRCLSLVVACLMATLMAIPAFASGVEPYYVGDGTVSAHIFRGSGRYSITATAGSDAERVEVSGTLYEDGWLWDTNVGSCSNSASGSACTASGNYSFESGEKLSAGIFGNFLLRQRNQRNGNGVDYRVIQYSLHPEKFELL